MHNKEKILQAVQLLSEVCNLEGKCKEKFIEKSSKKMLENLSGYTVDFDKIFSSKIKNQANYNSPIEIKDIPFHTHCKHHFSPIIGKITVSYTPNQWIIGFSRIIECVNALTQKLNLQEELTVNIAKTILKGVDAKSVSVEIIAEHYCMQKNPNAALPTIKTSYTV